MKDKILQALAAAMGAVVSFFSGLPPLIWILLAVMTLDYITGIICGVMGKSTKTENGKISSSAATMGLLKKSLILVVVLVAALVDHAVAIGAGISFSAVTGATCLWFIASEGMSIIENAATMGVKVPGVLLKALEIMHDKGEAKEDKPHVD
ncbi:MAG: phage holin family protein [Clostridia bacterium]|nr:phage holin family protein [Clostridia bacterium]